jgi:hypothetical protein
MSNIYANNINPRSGNTVTFPQNIKVLGTATYEDVANVDSVGIITAQSGVNVTGGDVKIGTTNNVTFGSRRALTVANGTTGAVISLYNNTTATANPRISSNPGGSEINDIGIHAASTNGNIIAYTNNDTERLRINSSGSVGIGTDNINAQLQVNNGLFGLEFNPNSENAVVSYNRTTSAYAPVGFQGSTVALRIGGSGTTALKVDSAGKIGINNTSPTQRVHVGGNIELNAYDSPNGSGGYYFSKGLIIGNAYDANKTSSDDRNAIIWNERGLDLDIATNDIIRQKITYDGTVCIGATMAPRTGFFNVNSITPAFQVEQAGPSDNGRFLSIVSNAGASAGYSPTLLIGKSRGTTVGSAGLLSDGDEIGAISFQGADGTHLVESARIVVNADGLTGADKMPGSITFQTTDDGASVPSRKLQILQNGLVWAAAGTSGVGNTDRGFYHGYSSPDTQSTGMTMKCLGIGGGSGPFDTGVSVNAGNAGGVALIFATRNTSAGTATDGAVYLMQFYYNGNNTPLVVHLGGDNWITWGQTAGNNLQASWSGVSNYSFGMIFLH